jgi:hypothetical protein
MINLRMMKSRSCAAVSCLFLLVAVGAVAADVTWDSEFDNTLYNTPKGWSTTQKSGTVMLIPGDLQAGEQAAIVITPGGELKGDFKDALIEFRSELRGKAKAIESPTKSATADEGYPVLYCNEDIQDDNGNTTQYRYFFASHPGDRIEFAMLVANTKDSFDRYTKSFEEFIRTLAYKNARPGAHVTTKPATQP